MAISFVTSRAPSERLRIALIAILGTLVALLLVAALLSIGQVAELFKERATLDQNYDLGHLGRFGRYILGFDLMLDRPLGIGPLQFSKSYFSEDPHNTFLNAFMSGGWLGGLAYLTSHARHRRPGPAFRVRAHALAADLPRGLRRLPGRRRRERHHRHRPLAPLFPDPGGALGDDGGLATSPCAGERAGVDERPQANWRSVAQPG